MILRLLIFAVFFFRYSSKYFIELPYSRMDSFGCIDFCTTCETDEIVILEPLPVYEEVTVNHTAIVQHI